MRPWIAGAVAFGSLVGGTASVRADPGRTDELARLWRESRLADLKAERDRIDAEIAALPAALPPSTPAPPLRVHDGSEQRVASLQRLPANAATPVPAATANSPTPPVAAPPGVGTDPAPGAVDGAVPAPADPAAAPPPPGGAQGGRQTFGGLDLGVGLSFTMDVGKTDRISRASVVNGIVRADDQDNGRARIMLESHYFFTPCAEAFFGLYNPCRNERGYRVADPETARWGIGPFIAVQPGSDNIIDAIGIGLMLGARREKSSQSFNLGFGIVLDPNTRVLGEGLQLNAPLPEGEKEVRYRETLQTGFLVLSSFSF